MTKYREILRLFFSLHLKTAEIAKSCRVSTKTIVRAKRRAVELGLSWPLPDSMTEGVLAGIMFPKKKKPAPRSRLPDMDYVSGKLLKGASRKSLWEEYVAECRKLKAKPLKYSGFCGYIKQDQKRRAESHLPSVTPGERIETCWMPDADVVTDSDTGKHVKVFIFVASMPQSGCAYAEAFGNMKTAAQIRAYVRLLGCLGGVPKIIGRKRLPYTPGNLDKDEEFIRAFREFCEHYGTAIIEANPCRKKSSADDKSAAERAAEWMLSALGEKSFTSLDLLNVFLRERLKLYNARRSRGTGKSHETIFREEEQPLLSPLPHEPYEYVFWKKIRIQLNGYVRFEYMHYSVPAEYAGKQADVRITDSNVEIFIGSEKVASHRRLYGRKWQYSTEYLHRYRKESTDPEDEKGLRRWAHETGPCTEKIAISILDSKRTQENNPVEACRLFLMLSKIYSPLKLETACRLALEVNDSPGYATVRDILHDRYAAYFGKRRSGWISPGNG